MTEYPSCNVLFDSGSVLKLQSENPHLYRGLEAIVIGESEILRSWVHDPEVETVLVSHGIDTETFSRYYAHEVFRYFVGVIGGVTAMGDCPVMGTFLEYLKDSDVTSDELYIICSHFRKAMLNYLCGVDAESVRIFPDITHVFDRNFAGVLKMYSGRLYEKELELAKNVKLLEEYKNAIDESSIVSKTDENGTITYVNDRFIDICGYSREELIGRKHNIVRHPDTPTEFFSELWGTIRAQNIYRGTMKNLKKNGDAYYMDLTILPIHDPVREITEYIGIGYEVTRLVEAREEAELAGQAKEYFLSSMSHEIRTPLNAILGFVSLLKDEDHIPKHQHYLDIIYSSGENLLSIINDILDFSKLRSGEFMIEHKPFNIHEELSHVLELFAPSANEKQITIFSFVDPEIPYELVADGLRMKQIVSNLLSNAIKFTPPEGCIDVLVQIEEGALRVLVQDDGIGIAEEDRERIFDAFSQGQNRETRISGGTGLGLAICKKLAEHMGGAIELESEPGRGSSFTLVLPVETGTTTRVEGFDTERFRNLKLGLLQSKRRRPEIVALMERYWEVFGFDVVSVRDMESSCCDLLFFVDSDIDDATRQRITASKTPAVAIMEQINDAYGDVENVTPLYFPIYCSKLYNTMGSALGFFDLDADAEASGSQRRFKGHLLVAEDNAANRELMKIILERYGVSYEMAEDGVEAFDAYRRGRFDLVLMDEQMPRMNGREAMEQIRKLEEERGGAEAPIVAITANVVKGVKEQGLKAGYAAFVGKPVMLREIEQVFDRFLEEDESRDITAGEAPLPGGDEVMGLDMQKLRKELMLETNEILMLLEVFMKKVGKLIPELKRAISETDYPVMAKLAHSIKGSSANFRLEEVQRLAKTLEDAASERRDDADYGGLFERLQQELGKVRLP